MLVVLAAPAVDACYGDDRGLLTCIRGLVDDRFDLGLETDAPVPPEAPKPITIEAPAPADPGPEMLAAEVPASNPPIEPTRSLVPSGPEKPAAPPATPPKIAVVPEVTDLPEVPATLPDPEAPLADAAEPATADVPVVEALPAVPPPEDPPIDRIITALAVEAPSELESAPPPVAAVPWFMPPMPAPLPEPSPAVAAVEAEPALVPVADPESAPALVRPSAEPAPDGPAPVVPPEETAPAEDAALPPPAPIEPAPEPAFPPLVTAESTVAAIDPVIPAVPEPAAPVLAPTIDAVEIDGDANFIAGNGPAGATMRLYVDGLPVGVSPVEGGRWLVEGTDLLTEEQQVLKVEALDPLTGRVLGDASIVFEGPIGPSEAEPAALPEVDPVPAPDEAAILARPAVDPPAEDPVPPAPPVELPPIAPVVPAGETPSVTILGPAAGSFVESLPTGEAGSVLSLGTAPTGPAILAQFTLPAADAAPLAVLRAVPVGDPGAGRFVSGKAIIRRGDTLWDIAHRFYGRGVHYRTIFRANRELIARPGRIYPGQVFDLPLVYDD